MLEPIVDRENVRRKTLSVALRLYTLERGQVSVVLVLKLDLCGIDVQLWSYRLLHVSAAPLLQQVLLRPPGSFSWSGSSKPDYIYTYTSLAQVITILFVSVWKIICEDNMDA